MLGAAKKNPGRAQALAQVVEWTRGRFGLAQDATILVAELACIFPGCPPLETVVGFWTPDGTRHHFKIFKSLEEVGEGDLPYAWLKDSLAVPEGFDCDCC